MREHHIGFSISVTVHILIIGAFFMLPVERYSKSKSMLIDFTIEKGRGIGSDGQGIPGAKDGKGKEESTVGKRMGDLLPAKAELVTASISAQPPATTQAQNIAGHHSDSQGQTTVHGNIGSSAAMTGGQGSQSSEKGIAGIAGGGQGRVLDYGRGGQAERNFAFIRENILRNIKYPERARRMGWEGKVLLSFVVIESGAIQDLKVLNSSGFRALDENAKEAVLKTTFSQKIPYRMVVVLPVEYRLE